MGYSTDADLKREDRLLQNSFFIMVLPFFLQSFALGATGVVDAIVVGHFLGTNELVALSRGVVVEEFADLSFLLLGRGGSIFVGQLLGAGKRQEADQVYSFCVVFSEIAAILMGFLALAAGPIAGMLTGGEDPLITESARRYIFWMFIIEPFNVFLLCPGRFIRTEGYAKVVSAYYIAANVLNLVFDIVLLQFVVRGIEAVIWGSGLGYIAAAPILLLYYRSPERMLHFTNPFIISRDMIQTIIRAGLPPFSKRIFSTGVSFVQCALVAVLFGVPGMLFGTLYGQVRSIISTFTQGVFSGLSVYVSVLFGEKDYHGIRSLIRFATRIILLMIVSVLLCFELFPSVVFALFGVCEMQAEMAFMLRIAMPVLMIEFILAFWEEYYEAVTDTSFSFLTVIFDTHVILAGVFVILWAVRPAGVKPVIYPWCVILEGCLSILLFLRYHIKKHSVKDWSRLPVADEDALYLTVLASEGNASHVSERIERFLNAHGILHKLSILLSLAAEEMVCIQMEHKEDRDGKIDIVVRINEEDIILLFRDKGKPFDLAAYTEEANVAGSNTDVVKRVATEVSYTRVLQMNNTILTFQRNTDV